MRLAGRQHERRFLKTAEPKGSVFCTKNCLTDSFCYMDLKGGEKVQNYKPTEFMAEDSHYDEESADYAVNFIECLSHTKGKWAGKKFELIEWQEKIIRDIFGTIKPNGYRQFNTAYIEIPKKQGKQLALDTLIPTPDGFTTMGEIQVGDTVFDENGNTCHVVAKSPVDDTEQAYRLTFTDGSFIVAGERHQWKISTDYEEKIITSKEIFEMTEQVKIRSCHQPYTTNQEIQRCWIVSKILNPEFHFLKSIEPLPEKVKMQCIQVDSPSHQYLVGRSFLPTHNSELAAAVALYLLCGDNEQRAEIFGCAADRQQASIVFDVAADMVTMCPALAKRTKVLKAQKRIVFTPTNSFYQVLSAEAYSKHGFNIHGVVFDELHTQPNRELFDVMTKGSGDARMQPLYFLITTAGTDTHSICYEQHQKAEDIIAGRKHDPTFYPVIYGANPDDDWTDPEVWKKANPSLGITVGIDKVEQACNSAKENPGEENAFRQLRLNQWVKQTVRWMPMDKWDACKADFDEKFLEGRVCYGGLDLSSTTDLTAFVLVFPPVEDDDRYYILPYFWVPEDTMALRIRKDHVPYDIWETKGFLMTTEGNVVHYGFIENYIDELGTRFNIREIAFDRWGAVQMSQNLEELGFTLAMFGQGFRDMSPPTKELMRLVLDRKIAHNGHPVLRWNMDNIFIRRDPAGNIKPDKEKSTEKIDGAVATIMALDRAIRCGAEQDNDESVYNSRDLIII